MTLETTNRVTCLVDGASFTIDEGLYLKDLAQPVRNRIKRDYPRAKNTDFICSHHLLKYRLDSVDAMINADLKQSQKIDRKLTRALQSDDYEITDVNQTLSKSLTMGQRISDSVARFGGSWGFIGSFSFFLVAWMIINGLQLFGIKFDPYPFILLNLCLSCIAALQAPIIMMSQNRAADRDRMDAENDYHVNLKSEHELRILHAKLDHLSQNQIPHSLEIAKLQLEIMGEMRHELNELRDWREKTEAGSHEK